MKYTVQVKPEIFIGTKIVYCNDVITTEVNVMKESYQSTGRKRFPNGIKGMLSLVI